MRPGSGGVSTHLSGSLAPAVNTAKKQRAPPGMPVETPNARTDICPTPAVNTAEIQQHVLRRVRLAKSNFTALRSFRYSIRSLRLRFVRSFGLLSSDLF